MMNNIWSESFEMICSFEMNARKGRERWAFLL